MNQLWGIVVWFFEIIFCIVGVGDDDAAAAVVVVDDAAAVLFADELPCELADHVVQLIQIAGIDQLLKLGQVCIFVNLWKQFKYIFDLDKKIYKKWEYCVPKKVPGLNKVKCQHNNENRTYMMNKFELQYTATNK